MDNHGDHDLNNNLLLSDLFLWDNPDNNPISSDLMDEAYLLGEPSFPTPPLFLNQQPNMTDSSFLNTFLQEKDYIINEPSFLMLHHPHNNNDLCVEPDVEHSMSVKRKNSLKDSIQGITKKPRKRKKRPVDPNAPPKPKRITGLNKPLLLSTSLQTIMNGATQLSRPEIVKRLWTYIKTNQLQDPIDRRFILCDENLKAIFQKDRVNSFGMNRDLSAHLTKIDITSPPSFSLVREDCSPVPSAETPDIMTPSDTEILQKWSNF